MLKQLSAWWQWLISATALPTRDELDAELDRLSPPPSWPTNPVNLPPRMSHTVPTLPSDDWPTFTPDDLAELDRLNKIHDALYGNQHGDPFPFTTTGPKPYPLPDYQHTRCPSPTSVVTDIKGGFSSSTVPAPHPAAHDAPAAQGRSYLQLHIAKGQ